MVGATASALMDQTQTRQRVCVTVMETDLRPVLMDLGFLLSRNVKVLETDLRPVPMDLGFLLSRNVAQEIR